MPKYRLTDHQKELLRSAAPKLKSEAIGSEWVFPIGDKGYSVIFCFPGELNSWKNVQPADLEVFADYGFMRIQKYLHSAPAIVTVNSALIVQAVENDFEIPEHLLPQGDNIRIGDISNSTGIVVGRNASVTIQQSTSSSVLGQKQFDELEQLINQLNTKLSQIPEEEAEEAEAIADSVQTIVDQVRREKPNRRILRLSVEGLRQAASDIQTVVGLVVIAEQIAQLIQPLF